MNKHDLIQKVKALDGISQDERAYLIDLINTKKKYGLVWEDKPEDVEETLRTHLPVLQEVTEKRITGFRDLQDGQDLKIGQGSKQSSTPTLFDSMLNAAQDANNQPNNPVVPDKSLNPVKDCFPNHTLIEGDNLHALTALTFTHEGRIDVIYIDPPYNTGKEDEFRYNDRWILKEDPFRHSTWLSFISKRLKIAKRLLSDTGVIIIHIDENEFDALNLLLETELFGESNSLGQIIWNKQNPKGDAKEIASMHEYVLVYAKNKAIFKTLDNSLLRPKPNAQKILNKAKRLFSKIGKKEIPEEIKEVIKPFNFPKEILKDFEVKYDLELVNKEFQAWINRQDFSGGEKAYKFIDENGKVWQSVSMAWPNKEQAPDDYLIPLIHPITGKPCPIPSRGWRNPSSTMKSLLDKNLIIFGVDENTQPRRKYLLEENMYENTPSIFNNGASDDDFFKELKINFAYPKPVEAAKYFLQSVHPNPAIILDFFAGSGTTLHATMALNAEDGGRRQCILVTNNENNICEEVTYERNKRVIEGYTNAKGSWVAGLGGNNLRYYRSSFVPSIKSETNKRLLTQASTELLCIKENCYNELTAEHELDPRQARIFRDDTDVYMVVVYHSRQQAEVCEALVGIIQSLSSSEKIKLYGFSPEKDTLVEEFYGVQDRIEAIPLPDAIYNAYKATFKIIGLDRI